MNQELVEAIALIILDDLFDSEPTDTNCRNDCLNSCRRCARRIIEELALPQSKILESTENSQPTENPWDEIMVVECCTCNFHFKVGDEEWDWDTCPKCGSGDIGTASTSRDSKSLCWISSPDDSDNQYTFCKACVEKGEEDLIGTSGTYLMPKINLSETELGCENCGTDIPAEHPLSE